MEAPGEIIAVDASSRDITPKILKQYRAKIITVKTGTKALARQVGVESARKKYVMFVDSDVKLAEKCLEGLRSDLEASGWAGIQAQVRSWQNTSYWQRAEDQMFSRSGSRRSVDRITTMATLFPRRILLQYPFDPNLDAEDIELSYRLIRHGFHLGIASATAFVYHYHRADFKAVWQQAYFDGLVSARFGLKYRSLDVFIDPLRAMFSSTLRTVFKGKLWLVPFYLVIWTACFFGVTAGFSKFYGK